MSTEITKTKLLKGGEWLIKESLAQETFTPEDFNEEQRMIGDMCTQYLDAEVYPILDRIDNLEPGLMKSLLTKAGEQGLLSVSFPEEYGGLGKDFVTATIVNEYLGAGHSFPESSAAHPPVSISPANGQKAHENAQRQFSRAPHRKENYATKSRHGVSSPRDPRARTPQSIDLPKEARTRGASYAKFPMTGYPPSYHAS
jgi:hypothetical protein